MRPLESLVHHIGKQFKGAFKTVVDALRQIEPTKKPQPTRHNARLQHRKKKSQQKNWKRWRHKR